MSRKSTVILEICASSIQSVIAANKGGAHRIELCSNLEQGGITPSYGLVQRALHHSKTPINVLIRPRAGNFNYNEEEFQIMTEDVKLCKRLGCDGVVLGVLAANNAVDVERTRELVRQASPLPVTFHRAFDDCEDKFKALEDVIATGCVRILTSGGYDTAEEGLNVLRNLVKLASGRIQIMPGAGVVLKNIVNIVKSIGVNEIHASAKMVAKPSTPHADSRFDVQIWETSQEIVETLIRVLESADEM